ncbi:alpha/beta fold hydrolase [Paenibacillus sp. GCM10012307]|uniref:Alpha/beta hydrolase n=1 Tax=Paenibacillus roseus TaxID=2798579 RepID=A0A934J6E6_9BACL|nr:alpha/beta hydrolase [Paenibacillus roseus]MBJ6362584.1 alpha/beta hydrolase [Paenibacillus roseus]
MSKAILKKSLKRLLIAAASLLALIVLFFVIVYTVDVVSSKSEAKKIESYGQLVPVDGKQMNVLIEGNGDDTIVLIPGFGTAAPALDFKPLIEQLSPTNKVVVVEPFGYGLSDETDKERTTENIASEIHEALQQLHINRYTLMGHSIAGIYSLQYVNQYPDEIKAFVGIDTSVPNQVGSDDEIPIESIGTLKKMGIFRLVNKLQGDIYVGLPFDEKTKEQMGYISNKNLNNDTTLNEMKHFNDNFEAAKQQVFPKQLPLLIFVQKNNTEQLDWIALHEEQIKQSDRGKLVLLDGDHYLHHTLSKEIAEGYKQFMQDQNIK